MSIKIHHGPPGSYKTSGAVQDDFIRWVFDGKTIVTNVRGLNDRDLIIDVLEQKPSLFGKQQYVPDAFDLIYIDTSMQAGRDKLARFWHWAPHGSSFLIDEIQSIYPMDWVKSDFKKLDYPTGPDQAQIDNRPYNYLIAFEMHRHYGWDFVFTAPSIKKVRPELRAVSEGAYRHVNKATIGLKGWYLELYHLADDTGQSKNDIITDQIKRIRKRTFHLYKSTATGAVKDTDAGKNIFKQPRVIIFVTIFISLIALLYSLGNPLSRHDSNQKTEKVDAPSKKPTNIYQGTQANSIDSDSESSHQNVSLHSRHKLDESVYQRGDYLADFDVYISADYGYQRDLNLMDDSGVNIVVQESSLILLGYRFERYHQCLWLMVYKDQERLITCQPSDQNAGLSRLQLSDNYVQPYSDQSSAALAKSP